MGNKTGGFLLGAVIGGAAAAATALLLTPKTGKQLRKELNDQLDGLLDATNEYTEYAKQKGTELSRTAKEKVNALSEQATEMKDEVLQNLQVQKELVTEELDDLADEALDDWVPDEEVVIELDETYTVPVTETDSAVEKNDEATETPTVDETEKEEPTSKDK